MRARMALSFALGLMIGMGGLYGHWTSPVYKLSEGQSFHKVSSAGTLNTSAVVDITGSDVDLCSALTILNDGAGSIMVEEGVSSVAAMTAASSEVKAGEEYVSAIRCRYVTLYDATLAGTTTYRVVAGY